MYKHSEEYGRDNRLKWSFRRSFLCCCDVLLLIAANLLSLALFSALGAGLEGMAVWHQIGVSLVCVYICRIVAGVYRQVWRFAESGAYMRLILSQVAAAVLAAGVHTALLLIFRSERGFSPVWQALAAITLDFLLALLIRHVYQYMYENANQESVRGNLFRYIINIGRQKKQTAGPKTPVRRKIKIAIVGAGRVGVTLAEDLKKNPLSSYEPCCFIDIDKSKIGRRILGMPVLSKEEATQQKLDSFPIQEIVFALPEKPVESTQALYEHYRKTGCRLKVYDFPMKQAEHGSKRQLREFDIEELLFRKALNFTEEKTMAFYQDKSVLISGGGGSIGSELCRQIARMKPARLVILDVYENGAYDIQQELKIAYGSQLNLTVEIVSICDREQLEAVFRRNRPQVVLHAAAHKHVPLMERNCVEAVRNNVFGTLNMVEVSEQFNVEKFIMISTDKAVNPTNVMGATKRMCEMIVQSRMGGKTKFSATRFGNVLGSNGSVIPLFKRQIASGGPITLTDKRIIRYFMTIPEASQLVLTSGAMAKNGELYVLDMGKPVKILELAENMIRLSGLEPYKDIDIIETGLRPGEKLYEELLIKSEDLDKTENSMIFIERDKPHSAEDIRQKLVILREALSTMDDAVVKEALKACVDTFHDPSEVNATASQAAEMKMMEEKENVAV